MDGTKSLCLNIVEAVAEHEGTSPDALQPPLYSAIDTDALAALMAGPTQDHPTVEFTYKGYTIRVAGPDAITVREPAVETDPETGLV